MIIELMREKYVEQVAAIEKEVFSLPWSANSFIDAINNDNAAYLIAREDDIILGYIGAWCVAGEAEITNVCVAPKYRKQGVAKELLKSFIEMARKDNTDIFFLEVRESNAGAIALYEGFGFKNIGLRKNFYERPMENAIVMSLTFFDNNSH